MYGNLKYIFWYSYNKKKNHGFYLYTSFFKYYKTNRKLTLYKAVEYEIYVIKKSQAVNGNNWYEINSN